MRLLIPILLLTACGFGGTEHGAMTDGLGETTIRLGTWNVRKLGHGDSTDIDAVASIVNANFDIIAITEIMQKASEGLSAPSNAPGYHDLQAALDQLAPGEWASLASLEPRPNNTLGSSEFYAIFYRRTRVRPCDGWAELRYVHDHDGGSVATEPLDLWIRDPAYGCFEAGELDFVLAAWHASYGSVPKTRQEAFHLTRVFDEMAAAVPGEQDLIIAGDFNLTVDELAKATEAWPAEFADARDRTLDQGTTIRRDGTLTNRAFDHLCVRSNQATNEMIGNAEPLHVYAGSEPGSDFYWEVSDHLPIMVELDVTLPDDDGPAREPAADLVLTGARLDAATVSAGQRVQASIRVHNAGVTSAGRSQVEYVFSEDAQLDGSDRYLNYDAVSALASGEHADEAANLRIPDVAPGDYWVLFVADANDTVAERDESDVLAVPLQVVAQRPDADLVLQASLERDDAAPGDQVGVVVQVRNAGTGAADDSRIKYYFSRDPVFDSEDTYRNYDRVAGLMPSETVQEEANVRIPEGAEPGVWYVIVIADVDGEVVERDEANNAIALPITVL